MPIYTYKCNDSGQKITRFTSMKNHSRVVACNCGSFAEQIIDSAPMVIIPQHMRYDWNGYESPVSGRHIRNLKERANDMAQHDCVEYDPGMKQDYERRIKEEDADFDKRLDEDVDRLLDNLPAEKMEQLGAELTAGLDINVERA